jgi:DNA polymerase V
MTLTNNQQSAPGRPVSALHTSGFPSPAVEHTQMPLDLNELIIQHPTATFFVRVSGQNMIGDNIHGGDLLVVDRSLEASVGRVVVAIIDGEFVVRQLRPHHGQLVLDDPRHRTESDSPTAPETWGVVTHIIRKV